MPMSCSSLEKRIHNVLCGAGVRFQQEYSFPSLVGRSGRRLRFDFAVFGDDGSIDYLIEAQGRQHYVPVDRFGGDRGLCYQRINDAAKRRWCILHGIRLVTIPYYDYDKIDYDYILESARG